MKKNTFLQFLGILSNKITDAFSQKNEIYSWVSFRNITLFLSISLLFFSSQIFGQFADVNPPTGGFAIDGGLRANIPIAGQGDWYPGSGGSGGSVFDNNGNVIAPATNQTSGRDAGEPYGSNDNIFTNGSKFNDYVTDLRWFSNSAPDKNDIDNALYHVSRDAANNQWIFISGDRKSTSGTSYIDFELLQGDVDQNTNGTFTGTPLASKPNGGGRTENDIIISMEYTNGGSKPLVYIYQWKLSGSKWSYQLANIANLDVNAFAETNRTGSELNLPYSAFGSNTYQQFAFVEAAVNITYLINQITQGASCGGLSINTLWVKTKASASSTAALKDFITPIPVNLDFGSTEITQIGPFCVNDPGAYDLTATPSGGTFTGSGVSLVGGVYKFTPNDAVPDLSGDVAITYTSSDGTCSGPLTIHLNPLPTATASNDGPICSNAPNFKLNETGGDAASWAWTSNGSAIITAPTDQSPTVTGFADGEQFTVTVTDANGCVSTSSTTIEVNEKPAKPGVTYIHPECDETTFSITISGVVQGATYIIKGKDDNEITSLTKNGVNLSLSSYTATLQDQNAGTITIEGFPAGAGYMVSLLANGCYSDANTCGASTLRKAEKIVPQEELKTKEPQKVGFTVFPVPFKDQLTVRYNFDYASQVLIEVFNSQGNKILSKKDSGSLNKEIQLNLNSKSGNNEVYFVKVTTDRESSVQKVISSR